MFYCCYDDDDDDDEFGGFMEEWLKSTVCVMNDLNLSIDFY